MNLNLSDEQKKQIIQAVITAVITLVFAVLGILGYNVGIKPAMDAQNVDYGARGVGIQPAQTYRSVRATQFVQNDGTLTQTGAATFSTTIAVTGASTFIGAATFSANPILPTQSITPTDGGTITPTLRIVTLTPAGALGTALGACTTGHETVLYNSVNANVVISDTGNFIGAGNQTLGQYDALRLACIDSKWVQVSAVSAN